ncbi:hypothetical protein HHK36_031686 [Tetracentron sinense]|uniref:Uncharacterized protein n=1 Tax=Tetracentron sinense TaxID=13715 RepID=A0A834Y6I0_TETSI|nr:hypothetical protein HHK36_031686 [Tetracentron sinense]
MSVRIWFKSLQPLPWAGFSLNWIQEGNPMRFARNVGIDIRDFLSVTAKGILQSIVAFTIDDQVVAKMEIQQKGIASHSNGVFNEFFVTKSNLVEAVNGGLRKMLINPNVKDPLVLGVRVWPQAISQFLVGHLDLLEATKTALGDGRFERLFPGVNYVPVNEVVGTSPLELVVNGAAASYEAYLKFLNKFPSIEKDWDLQLLPITSLRPLSGGVYSRPRVAAIPKTEDGTSTLPNWDFSMHTVNLRRAAGIPRAKGGAYVYSQDI